MSQNQGGITKRVNHTPAFLRAAEQDKTGALAYLLYASFGVSLSEILAILRQLIENEDENLAHMAITASTQIRNNVVFVGNDFGGIRQQYPILIIEGERPQQDIYNFSALHVLGHALCHCSTTAVARKILTKAGSAVNGQGVTDSVAGKINKELSDSWALEDRQEFNMFLVEITAAQRASIDQVFDGLRAKATAFRTLMQAQAAPQQAIVIGGGGGGVPMAQVAAPAVQAAAAAAPGNAPAVGAPPAGNRPGRQPPAAPGNATGGAAQ